MWDKANHVTGMVEKCIDGIYEVTACSLLKNWLLGNWMIWVIIIELVAETM